MDSNKRNTLISLTLHLLILIAFLSVKSANILVPSRSDGMEVSLVSAADLTPTNTIPQPQRNDYQIQNTNPTEVKVKQVDKTPIPPKPKPQPKIIPHPKKVAKNAQLNDLINDLAPSQNSGHSRGTATGGSAAGTADTANLVNNYADLVIARVRPFVIIPDNLSTDAKAVIEVTLLPNMTVYNVTLIKSSGNNDYDNSVQQAVTRVHIFPPLPDGTKFSDFRKLRLTFKPN